MHTFRTLFNIVRNPRKFFQSSRKRTIATVSTYRANKKKIWIVAAFAGFFVGPWVSSYVKTMPPFGAVRAEEKKNKVNFDAVRKDIESVLDDPNYDDGSYGPVIIRLAWHASGTYDRVSGTGGSDGATMRFSPEATHGANSGLAVARERLESVKRKHPDLSYADLWTLAAVVAIEHMGGPQISWRPGRIDKIDGKSSPPDGRLPDASKGPSHVREIFSRMGFNDQDMVALIGAHAVGRCHADRTGYDGPWTQSPTVFSNDFYVQLLERKWTLKKWKGPKQYEDESGTLMMLPGDMALMEDPAFKKWVVVYANDEDRWHQDFAKAFSKLLELGVKF